MKFWRKNTGKKELSPIKWISFYNNTHPSKKYPEICTALWACMLCLFCGMSFHSIPNSDNSNTNRILFFSNKKNSQLTNTIANNNIKDNVSHKPSVSKAVISKNSSINNISHNVTSLPEIKHNASNDTLHFLDLTINEKVDETKQNLYAKKVTTSNNFSGSGTIQKSSDDLHFELYTTTPSLMHSNLQIGTKGDFNLGDNSGNFKEESSFHLQKKWEIEAGGAVLFDLTNYLRLKAGMQLNYSSYELADVNQMNKLLSSSSSYGNLASHSKEILFNNVYQLSIPLGTEWRLVGNSTLDWFAGATFQPSLLLSDLNFSALDEEVNSTNPMLRRWNVYSTFETFLNYHLSENTSLKLGPQFRYQFMPSLQPAYNVSERLYNIGLKLGVTGNF